jgi:hypothetical protein
MDYPKTDIRLRSAVESWQAHLADKELGVADQVVSRIWNGCDDVAVLAIGPGHYAERRSSVSRATTCEPISLARARELYDAATNKFLPRP